MVFGPKYRTLNRRIVWFSDQNIDPSMEEVGMAFEPKYGSFNGRMVWFFDQNTDPSMGEW
jgi:hypothetical protein